MKYIISMVFLTLLISSLFSQEFEIGQKAPEISLKSVSGEEISLSSLKGQLVLIDFWASWCPPCRKENPQIVRTYNKYKDTQFKNGEGFTVYSVSLDTKQNLWEAAILKDKLDWSSHVSDLKGFRNQAAVLYNIKSVPFSYLIDGDGVIVAINPRGDLLENNLKKLKKKTTFFSSKK